MVEADTLKLLERRRTGKSSVAEAVVARFHSAERPAALVDLSRQPDPAQAAHDVADQLAPALAALSRARQATGWLAALWARLNREGDERALDEAHIVAEWPDEQQSSLREFLRNDTRVGVIVSSSLASALESLTAEDAPLRYVGQRVPLPPIDRGDWEAALPPRFLAVQAPIDAAALGLLLDESRCQPYCTMLLCRASARAGLPGECTDAAAVRAGLLEVAQDEAWELRDG